MDTQLFTELGKLEHQGVIYLKPHMVNLHPHDIQLFRIWSDYLTQYCGEEKANVYYDLLRSWYVTLCRLKENKMALEDNKKVQLEGRLLFFYEAFQQRTNHLSDEETLTLLYRYPWFLRRLLVSSTEKTFNETFVHNVATLDKLDDIHYEEISYLAITTYDHKAMELINQYVKADDMEKFTRQLTKNIDLIPYIMEHYEMYLQNEDELFSIEEKEGVALLAKMLRSYEKQEELSAFQHVLLTLSACCFWHVEATNEQRNWFIKSGPFQHLKRFINKVKQ